MNVDEEFDYNLHFYIIILWYGTNTIIVHKNEKQRDWKKKKRKGKIEEKQKQTCAVTFDE